MFAYILKHVRMDKNMQISWGEGYQNDCHIKFYFCNQGNSFFKQLSEPFPIEQAEQNMLTCLNDVWFLSWHCCQLLLLPVQVGFAQLIIWKKERVPGHLFLKGGMLLESQRTWSQLAKVNTEDHIICIRNNSIHSIVLSDTPEEFCRNRKAISNHLCSETDIHEAGLTS